VQKWLKAQESARQIISDNIRNVFGNVLKMKLVVWHLRFKTT